MKVREEEHDSDENDPDGAAQGGEETEAVELGSIVGEGSTGCGHLVVEEPDAQADEQDGEEVEDGEAVKEAGVSDQEECAETDEPDGSRGKTITRQSCVWIERGRRGSVRRVGRVVR